MPDFTVYKIEMPDGTIKYEAYSEAFLRSEPISDGCQFGYLFLPVEGQKYFQFAEAEGTEQAIATAKACPNAWKWSMYNREIPEEWLLPPSRT